MSTCSFCDKRARIDYEWNTVRRSHCLTKECMDEVGTPQPDALVLVVYYYYANAPTFEDWKKVVLE